MDDVDEYGNKKKLASSTWMGRAKMATSGEPRSGSTMRVLEG
jgi:hypothetical protein